MEFRKFCRTLFMDESKTSFRFLDTIDAVVTDTVDYFKFILKGLKNGERYVGDNESVVRKDGHR